MVKARKKKREITEFVVPTGNFGNVFAGWLLTKMGIPVGGFRVATNQNDVMHRLFASGQYELTSVYPSLAPSMDIQIASNFERLLFYFLNGNTERVCEVMQSFRTNGRYSFEQFDIPGFSSCCTTDAEIPKIIQKVYKQYSYLVDPHTACAFNDLDEKKHSLILATAHPAKFPGVFSDAGMECPTSPVLEALLDQQPLKYRVGVDANSIKVFIQNKLPYTTD